MDPDRRRSLRRPGREADLAAEALLQDASRLAQVNLVRRERQDVVAARLAGAALGEEEAEQPEDVVRQRQPVGDELLPPGGLDLRPVAGRLAQAVQHGQRDAPLADPFARDVRQARLEVATARGAVAALLAQ